MEVHKKIDFTLEKYYELKDTPNFEVKNSKGKNVRILETNEEYDYMGENYPIIALVNDDEHITRFSKNGHRCCDTKTYLTSCELFIYYDTYIESEINSIVMVYNNKKYTIAYSDRSYGFSSCDACALRNEAQYDKRICKICGAFQTSSCGKQFFKLIK